MKIRIKKFKTVKSTNDIAIKLIQKNNSKPTNYEKQTKGREGWEKMDFRKGNLFFTIFLNRKKY